MKSEKCVKCPEHKRDVISAIVTISLLGGIFLFGFLTGVVLCLLR